MNGQELKEIRKFFGLSQKELGDLTNLTNRTIFNYEQMEALPPGKSLDFQTFFKSYSEKKGLNIVEDETKYPPAIIKYLHSSNKSTEIHSDYPSENISNHTVPLDNLSLLHNDNGNRFIPLPNGEYIMTIPLLEPNEQINFTNRLNDIDYLMQLPQHTWTVEKPEYPGPVISFRVVGDSMDDGSIYAVPRNSIVTAFPIGKNSIKVILRQKLKIRSYLDYFVIYLKNSKTPLIKEVTEFDPLHNTITCHSLKDSPEYQDFKVNMDEIERLFLIVDVTISLKESINPANILGKI